MKEIKIDNNCNLNEIPYKCFSHLTNEETDIVKNSKVKLAFEQGEMIFKQNSFANGVVFIVDGIVKQTVESSLGKKINTQLIDSGNFAGIASAFDNKKYNYSIIAVTDTICCVIEKDALINLMHRNTEFAISIMRKHFANENYFFSKIADINYKQMNGRIADTLLYINKFIHNNNSVFPLLSRKDIAEFASLSVESTVKILKNFESEGLISLIAKDIIILKKEHIENISRNG